VGRGWFGHGVSSAFSTCVSLKKGKESSQGGEGGAKKISASLQLSVLLENANVSWMTLVGEHLVASCHHSLVVSAP
jgi:hypothetical protein